MKNEGLPVAEAVGVEKQYKELSESGRVDTSQIKKWLRLLHDRPENWIAGYIDKAEPFDGSRETIDYLEKHGIVKVITKNPLMSLPECNEAVKRKLGGKIEIIPTSEMKMENGYWILEKIRTKSEVLEGLIRHYNPSRLLCFVHDLNDYGIAEYAKSHGGTVISVNSHSPELESVSHHHINSIAEAPKLLEEILLK